MSDAFLIAVANHLWQSTLFVVAAAGLTLLLRQNRARVRWAVWLAASLKFLLPFSLLTTLGAGIPWPAAPLAPTSGFLAVAGETVARVAQIHPEHALALAPGPHLSNSVRLVRVGLEVLWALGALLVAVRWLRHWRLLRGVLKASSPSDVKFIIPVRCSAAQTEPAVVGVLAPVLLVPQDLPQRLAPAELAAVLAHEHSHVQWHDNLTASAHMLVETLMWFHPLVWWLGRRLIAERERACDERVLEQGHAPHSYAEGILKVCEIYLQSPLPSAAGVGGGDLKHRIESIMNPPVRKPLHLVGKLMLALAAAATVAIPLGIGAAAATQGTAAASEDRVAPLRNVSIELAPPQLPPYQQAPALYNAFGLVLQDNTRTRAVVSSLRDAIAAAYGVSPAQVVGMDLSRVPAYQITADNPWPETPTDSGEVRKERFLKMRAEVGPLWRQLLTHQFGLVVKRERRPMRAYVLTVDPGGAKLQPDTTASDIEQGMGSSDHEIIGTRQPLGPLVFRMQSMLGAPVLDDTGLAGTYDYKLIWEPAAPGTATTTHSLARALQEQLGLRLEEKTVALEAIDVVGLKSPQQVLTSR